MKRLISFLLVFLMIITVFAGCSGNKQKAAPAESISSTSSTSESKTEKVKTLTISIGYVNNPGEPIDLACQEWARLLEERTNGAMKLELYPSSQLGSMNEIYDMAQANDNVIAYGHGGFYADLGIKQLNAMYAPYIFKNWDEFDKLMSSKWMEERMDELDSIGLKMISKGWHYGIRHTLTKEPINSIEDLKGKKIRVPNSVAQIKGYESLGATPTPMNLSECYTALQQGVIDGVENPIDVIYAQKHHEVAKYLTLTGHLYNDASWTCGTGFFNSLTGEQQKALLETGEQAAKYFNTIAETAASDALEKMKAEGVQVSEIDYDSYMAKAKKYFEFPEFSDWPKDIRQTLMDIINK